ncbi:MAG: hypothetical protein IT445_14640 [Phycisphaeraceae bacterium]|nr:hypothetical protein [Phycisphaeraceae bacterium]
MAAIANLASFGFGWQELIVIALVVVFVSHIISKRRHKHRHPAATAAVRMMAVVAMVVICLVALLAAVVGVRMQHVSQPVIRQYGNVATATSVSVDDRRTEAHLVDDTTSGGGSVTIAGSPWTSAVEEHQDFEADVYPALESAAQAVGRRLAGQLPVSITAVRFEPIRDDSLISVSLQDAVAEGLWQKRPELKVVLDPPAAPDQALFDKAALVKLATRDLQTRTIRLGNQTNEYRSGWLTAIIGSTDPAISASARFNRVFWLTDPQAFQPSNGHDWLIAYSDGFKTSQSDAHRDAIDASAKALEPQVRSHFTPPAHVELVSDDLCELVAAQLQSRQPFDDQFTQRFDRPYGTVWREALLMEVSPTLIDSLARSINNDLTQQVRHQRTTWFSLIALVVLIFGTYLFLNAATRGYYTWSLRLVLLLGLAVAGYLVMQLS